MPDPVTIAFVKLAAVGLAGFYAWSSGGQSLPAVAETIDAVFATIGLRRKDKLRDYCGSIGAELAGWAHSSVAPGHIQDVRLRTEELLSRFALTRAEFVDADLKPEAAADRVLAVGWAGSPGLGQRRDDCRRLLAQFYYCLRRDREFIDELRGEIDATLLDRSSELKRAVAALLRDQITEQRLRRLLREELTEHSQEITTLRERLQLSNAQIRRVLEGRVAGLVGIG